MLKIIALFAVLLAFAGCSRMHDPLADVVRENDNLLVEAKVDDPPEMGIPSQDLENEIVPTPTPMEVPPGDPSEPPEVIGEVPHVPLTVPPPLVYYQIVDSAFENADVIADASDDRALFFLSGNYHILISAELGVSYTLEIDSEVAGAYRAAKGLPADADVSREETAREYLRLRLEFPKETHAAIMERYTSSLEPSP